MKSGENRVPFFYHEKVKDAIVITHIFVKKQQKCPQRELEGQKSGVIWQTK